MAYTQRFGLSRKSPLAYSTDVEKYRKKGAEKREAEDNPATDIINKNISNVPVSSPPPSLDANRLNDPNYNTS